MGTNVAAAFRCNNASGRIGTHSAHRPGPGSDPGFAVLDVAAAPDPSRARGTIERVPRREDATSPPARRPSAKQVLIAVAIGFVLLFGAGVAFQAASTGADAVSFRGGRYVDPVPLTRAQIEHDYGVFKRAGAQIDGRPVYVPIKTGQDRRPAVIFVLEHDGRNAVLYGLRK